jgi:glucose-1-phosphate thymidylyltransferase
MKAGREGIILAGGSGGLKIGCPEEIAYRMGYIDDADLERLAGAIINSEYSGYLRRLPATKT